MRATVMHGAGDVRVEDVPDAVPMHPTDAVLRINASPGTQRQFDINITIAGGPAPTRAFVADLLPDVVEGRIHPGRVFDHVIDLDGVPEGYQAMEERRAPKVLIEP